MDRTASIVCSRPRPLGLSWRPGRGREAGLGLRACLKMERGPAAGEFWVGQGGERRGRPPAVCSARTNAVQAGKTRRPEGLGGKGPLAALLVGHRPLRVCFLLAPCQSNPSLPNRPPPFSDRLLGVWRTDLDGSLGALGALRENSRFGRETGYGFGPFGFESFELRAFGFGALTSGTEFPQWNNPKNRPLRVPSGPDS